jgi:hypothetical protein
MDTTTLKAIASIIQAVVTSGGIVVGGVWTYRLFVKKRQKYPRASVRHDISHRKLGGGHVLLNVRATISNAGEVLLSLESAETRVQQILPLGATLLDDIREGKDLVPAGETEVPWPSLFNRKSERKKGEFQIEPGESDSIQYDFVLPERVRTVEVYTYLKNEAVHKRNIGWSVTTIYDLSPRKATRRRR